MFYSELNLLAFQKRFRTVRARAKASERMRWPDRISCPQSGHRHGYRNTSRRLIACVACRCQVSLTVGSIFHKAQTPSAKCFSALYLVSQDNAGGSALRLSKHLGLRYKTASLMFQKFRQAMRGGDYRYQVSDLVEMDDAFSAVSAPASGDTAR